MSAFFKLEVFIAVGIRFVISGTSTLKLHYMTESLCSLLNKVRIIKSGGGEAVNAKNNVYFLNSISSIRNPYLKSWSCTYETVY